MPIDHRSPSTHRRKLLRLTRRARDGHWFPITLFGLLTLAVALVRPVSWHLPSSFFRADGSSAHRWVDPLRPFVVGWVSPIWMIGIPLVYAATVAVYLGRAARVGVGTSRLTYALAGAGFLVTVGAVVAFAQLPGETYVRGLSPMYAIAAGFFVLSYLERIPISDDAGLVNPLVVAVYLLAGGVAFAVAHRPARRRA